MRLAPCCGSGWIDMDVIMGRGDFADDVKSNWLDSDDAELSLRVRTMNRLVRLEKEGCDESVVYDYLDELKELLREWLQS